MNPEAARQSLLLRALLREGDSAAALATHTRNGARFERGLAAYRANAGALAERALAAAYPVLQQLIGEESFAGLARTFWRAEPPGRGDIGQWGATLPAFITADASLAEEPYLADVARLEWALHEAAQAADDDAPLLGIETLAEEALWPRLQLLPRAGTALIDSVHPIAAIVDAHTDSSLGHCEADRFAAVRAAFAAGTAQPTLVWRAGWAVQHAVLPPTSVAFTQALLQGRCLLPALKEADADFDFEAWLIDTLQKGWLACLSVQQEQGEPKP